MNSIVIFHSYEYVKLPEGICATVKFFAFYFLCFSVNIYFSKRKCILRKKIQGEFNVTEKVKRKKGNHIPSRRFF